MSEETIFSAFVAAQSEFVSIGKDGINPFLKNGYATLLNIITKIRPILKKHNLSFVQSFDSERKECITKIIHASGGEILSSVPFAPTCTKPQEIGSAITYAKRYGLLAAFGLSVDDDPTDDDGDSAQRSVEPIRPTPPPPKR